MTSPDFEGTKTAAVGGPSSFRAAPSSQKRWSSSRPVGMRGGAQERFVGGPR